MTHIPTLRVKFWTPNKIQQLLDLNEEGMSASQMGRILGCSRCAVMGKLMRKKVKMTTARGEVSREYARRPPRLPVDPVAAPVPSPDEPVSLNISMMDVRDGQCRFIANDPAQGATCCGHPTLLGRAWCFFHFRRVFQPAKPYLPAELRG